MTKKEALSYFKQGNKKLNEAILVWNLPAGKEGTCSQTCPGCYALKAETGYFGKTVRPSRQKKLELSKQDDFIFKAIDAIKKLEGKFVRIHESGDFYSQSYVNKWHYIAHTLKDVMFTAYSREFSNVDLDILRELPNVIVIDSKQHGPINYGQVEDKPNDAVLCPCGVDGDKDIGCLNGCDICYNLDNKEALEKGGIFFQQH